jgi:hypothetical protein
VNQQWPHDDDARERMRPSTLERERMRIEQARVAKLYADYERRQRGDHYRPTLRATPITKERK